MKIHPFLIVGAVFSAGLCAPAAAAEEEAKELNSYSVGERRQGINPEEFKVERPKFDNAFKIEPTKPSIGGMKFARPQLQVLPEPTDPGPIASADGARTPPAQSAPPVPGGESRSVQPLSMEPPSYPRDALLRQQEGYVVVEFTVTPTGETADINVVESEPRNAFDREALRAVARWQFEPALRDGRPVSQRIRHTLEFTLEGQ